MAIAVTKDEDPGKIGTFAESQGVLAERLAGDSDNRNLAVEDDRRHLWLQAVLEFTDEVPDKLRKEGPSIQQKRDRALEVDSARELKPVDCPLDRGVRRDRALCASVHFDGLIGRQLTVRLRRSLSIGGIDTLVAGGPLDEETRSVHLPLNSSPQVTGIIGGKGEHVGRSKYRMGRVVHQDGQ